MTRVCLVLIDETSPNAPNEVKLVLRVRFDSIRFVRNPFRFQYGRVLQLSMPFQSGLFGISSGTRRTYLELDGIQYLLTARFVHGREFQTPAEPGYHCWLSCMDNGILGSHHR